MQVKLKTGSFESGDGTIATTSAGGAQLDKRCLLVYAGTFDSMDGEVTITPDHLTHLAETHNSILSRLKASLGGGEVPVKHNPPLQLDHSTSAKDTVGRLVGLLETGEYTLEDGSKVPALYGTARVLGKENVDKVIDGRWCNLSIGADLETGKLNELTITPFPAAPGATMLARKGANMSPTYKIEKYLPAPNDTPKWKYTISVKGEKVFEAKGYDREDQAISDCQKAVERMEKDSSPDFAKMSEGLPKHIQYTYLEKPKSSSILSAEMPKREGNMHEHLKAHLKHLGVAEEKHEDFLKRMSAHLMGEKKMSEDEAHQHMGQMTPELWDQYAKHMNHLSSQEGPAKEPMPKAGSDAEMAGMEDKMPHTPSEAQMSRLSQPQKDKISQLMKNFNDSMAKVKFSQSKARLLTRLSSFKTSAQLTPAEVKKFDITQLSKKSSDFIDGMFHAIQNNDPKVFVGLHGSSKAIDVSKLSEEHKKKVRMSALEADIRSNMSSVAKTAHEDPMKMSGKEEVPAAAPVHASSSEETEEAHMSMEQGYEHLKKLMGEGKDDEAKAHLKKMMSSKQLGGEDVQPAQSEETHEEMKKLHANFNELIKLTGFGTTSA
jgi:hypothetical protein